MNGNPLMFSINSCYLSFPPSDAFNVISLDSVNNYYRLATTCFYYLVVDDICSSRSRTVNVQMENNNRSVMFFLIFIPVYGTFSCHHLLAVSAFRKYSAIQQVGSFHYVHKAPFGNYSFICADATLTPGPKRPYNFFGILSQVGHIQGM